MRELKLKGQVECCERFISRLTFLPSENRFYPNSANGRRGASAASRPRGLGRRDFQQSSKRAWDECREYTSLSMCTAGSYDALFDFQLESLCEKPRPLRGSYVVYGLLRHGYQSVYFSGWRLISTQPPRNHTTHAITFLPLPAKPTFLR